jgi:hypothetical protein
MFKVFFRPFYYSLRSGSSYCFVGCLSIWFHCEFRKPGFVSLFWMEGLCSCPFPSVCISSTCVVPSTWSFAASAQSCDGMGHQGECGSIVQPLPAWFSCNHTTGWLPRDSVPHCPPTAPRGTSGQFHLSFVHRLWL